MKETLRMRTQNLALHACQGSFYPSWSDEFCRKELRDYMSRSAEKVLSAAAFQELTDDERIDLGFRRWSDEGPWLIPLFYADMIPDGETLHCIDGSTITSGKDKMDLDIRGGMIAFGFVCPSKELQGVSA